MATKTITLKLDAHERRRTAKKAGESFSEVVRRASFADAPLTGEALRAYLHSGGSGISEHYLAKKLRSSEPFNRADALAFGKSADDRDLFFGWKDVDHRKFVAAINVIRQHTPPRGSYFSNTFMLCPKPDAPG